MSGLHQLLEPQAGDAFGDRLDRDFGIDAGQRGACGIDFFPADGFGEMHDLPLQISEVHRVVVAEGDAAHAAGGKVKRRRRAQSAGADQQRVRAEQLLLPVDADLGQENVAAVTQ